MKLSHRGLYVRCWGRACVVVTHASLDRRRSRLPSGRFTSLELSFAVRHIAAVSVRVPATAQDCAVCRAATTVNATNCLRRDSAL